MPAERGNGPLGTPSNWPVIDRGTLALTASPRLGPLGQHAGQRDFDTAFSLANAEIANAGTIAALDGATRARYDQLLREFRNEIYARVGRGDLTWQQAVEHAHGMRDDVMLLIRRRSTPVGRSAAEWLKPTSPPLNDLIAKRPLSCSGRKLISAGLMWSSKTASMRLSSNRQASQPADYRAHAYPVAGRTWTDRVIALCFSL